MSATKPKKKLEEYRWQSSRGVLQMWMLRDYARWLFPQIGRKWEAEGILDFTLPEKVEDKPANIYRFPKSTGPVLRRELAHFRDYVFAALKPQSDRMPYQWPRSLALIFVADLRHLHTHIQSVLKKHREETANP